MRGTSLPFLVLALLITIAWIVSPVIAQQLPPSVPGPRTIVAGKSLAGITIGSSIDVVVARFGAPSAVLETDRDAVYVWHRFGVNVYVRDGGITAVSTSNSLMRAGEIGPGFRANEAVRVFGPAYQRGTVEGFQGLQFDELGIAFGIDRKAVAVIVVFSPGQAAQVSGLQRAAKLVQTAAAVIPPAVPMSPLTQFVTGMPFVAGQRAYSTVTNYMSLSGYLRWLVYQSSANWITVSDASRVVKEQTNVLQQPQTKIVPDPQTKIVPDPQTVTDQRTSTVQESPLSTVPPSQTNTVPEQETVSVQQGE